MPHLVGRRAAMGAAAFVLARPALAQSWPARPVRFIVPYGAGNQADQTARVLADGLRPAGASAWWWKTRPAPAAASASP